MKRLIEIDNTAGTYLEYDEVDDEHTECKCYYHDP